MKLDTLVGMAKETAAFGVHPSGEYIYSFYTEQLQAFAKLVAQHAQAEERKICAEIAEWCIENHLEHHIPERIRARGNASIRGQA
jgi:hypothetical protein